MPDGTTLLIGMISGVFGVAYFMYGKKQAKLSALISGVLLCVYPYFIESVALLCIIGIVLLAAPFVYERYFGS
jgi:predicted membrane-bound dolichyl-phosphate-mannose-protein mannosyltransferase